MDCHQVHQADSVYTNRHVCGMKMDERDAADGDNFSFEQSRDRQCPMGCCAPRARGNGVVASTRLHCYPQEAVRLSIRVPHDALISNPHVASNSDRGPPVRSLSFPV